MAVLETRYLITFLLFVISVSCGPNSTNQVTDATTTKESKPSGTLASLGRMIVDLPLGLVEAFKDGAEAIESVVLGLMRTIFT